MLTKDSLARWMSRPIRLLVAACCVGFFGAPAVAATKVTFDGVEGVPQIAFASAEIEKSAEAAREDTTWAVEFAIDSASLKPQGYRLDRAGSKIRIIGGDANGAMYGGLDVAEAIR